MKKHILLFLSLFTVVVLSIGIASCSEDPPPAAKPELSMAVDEMSVDEDEGTIEVELVLDKPASTDLIIEYEISGSADEGTTASSDYEIQGDIGEVEFQVGQTSAIIEIDIHNDNIFEGDETIELRIQDANTDDIIITNNDETEITIEDDDTQSVATFAVTALSLFESDGLLTVEVKLDKAVGQDVTVQYSLTGTARDSVTAGTTQSRDYAIRASESGGAVTPGSVVIPAGETTGFIKMIIYSDFILEDPETIIMTLTTASGGVTLGTAKVLEIDVEQENGLLVVLEWGIVNGLPTYDDVDMDLFLWVENASGSLVLSNIASTAPSFDPLEILFLPDVLRDGDYGFSYNYYEGTEDPMNFHVTLAQFLDGDFEVEEDYDEYDVTYTLDNINPWFTSEVDPLLVQTYNKVGSSYEFSGIQVPAEGSRMRSGEVPADVVKKENVFSNRISRFLNH